MLIFTTVSTLFSPFLVFVCPVLFLFNFFLVWFGKLDNDYYYGGSMRDLSGRQTGRARKTSSASHIGKFIVWRSKFSWGHN